MSNTSDEKNPDLRCSRVVPACNHKQMEHAKERCFGVSIVRSVVSDCRCKRFLAPVEKIAPPRQSNDA